MPLKPWQKGQSGNPKGRPPGSKHKLQEDFLRDFCHVWEQGGLKAIKHMAENDPARFVEAAIKVLPKDVNHNIRHSAADMSDDELAELIRSGRGIAEAEDDPQVTH